ncbi:hypothetical protein Ocin01_14427 [Orchesella cincta]|uniref:Uncharacterized protein n=1 Tax=Orchesella cincta TaxID=48709 RepID=A0A1D2MH10_ORCCI|nr:hypothetical protein Ocin01_14427 [Orchesella cincta]
MQDDCASTSEGFDVEVKQEVVFPPELNSEDVKPCYSELNWEHEFQSGYVHSEEPIWSHFAVYLEELSEYNSTKSGSSYVQVIQSSVSSKPPEASKTKGKTSSRSYPVRPLHPIPSNATPEEAAKIEERRKKWREAFKRRDDRKKEQKKQEEALRVKMERKREIWRASYNRRKEMVAAKQKANYNSDPEFAERRRQQWRESYKRRMEAKRAAKEEELKKKPKRFTSSPPKPKATKKRPVQTKEVAGPSKKRKVSSSPPPPPRKTTDPVQARFQTRWQNDTQKGNQFNIFPKV